MSWILLYTEKHIQTNIGTDKHTDKDIHNVTDRQTLAQINRQTKTYTNGHRQ